MKNSSKLQSDRIIIIKRKSYEEETIPKGSWKIAYADFVTSMMAFFLLMWLINVTDPKVKDSIVSFFNPIHMIKEAKGKKGLNKTKAPEVALTNEPKMKDATAYDSGLDKQTIGVSAKAQENAMMQDPFTVIGEIEKEGGDSDSQSSSTAKTANKDDFDFFEKNANPIEQDAGDAQLDNFVNNLYLTTIKTARKQIIEERKSLDEHKTIADALSISKEAQIAPSNQPAKPKAEIPEVKKPPLSPIAPPPIKKAIPNSSLTKMEQQIEQEFAGTKSSSAPEVEVKATKNGLRIDLSDKKTFGMFSVGSAKPTKATIDLLTKLVKILNNNKLKIIINGHTDARPYRSHSYDNWQLSSSRAQMVYYILLKAGLDRKLVDHIAGYADSDLKDSKNPYSPQNRRIEILLLPKKRPLDMDVKHDNLDKTSNSVK